MGVSVAADALEGAEDAATLVNSTVGNPHFSWRASSKRHSELTNAAVTALIPLLVVLALTIFCFSSSRRPIPRSHAAAGRRLAAGEEEESDAEQRSKLIEACLDLQAEIGYLPQSAGPGQAPGDSLASSPFHYKEPQEPAQAVDRSPRPGSPHGSSAPPQSHAHSKPPKVRGLDLSSSLKSSQLTQHHSSHSFPSSELNTPVVSPSSPSYLVGSSSAFSFEEGSLAFAEELSSWGHYGTGEKRASEDVESSDAMVPPKRQKAETSESSDLQQLFPSRADSEVEASTKDSSNIHQQVSPKETQAEGEVSSEEIPATSEEVAQEAYLTFSMSDGSIVPVYESEELPSPSSSTSSSVASQVQSEVPSTSPDAESTSFLVEAGIIPPTSPSYTQISIQFPLPPPAPVMPDNTHLYYRLPVFIPTTKDPYVFNASHAFKRFRISKLLTDELRTIRFYLAQRSLDSLRAQLLAESCERLVNVLIHEHTTNIEEREHRHAAEILGRRYLALEGLFCAIQVLGPLMKAETWWPRLIQEVPTSFSRGILVSSRRSTELFALAKRLSEATESLKRGVRPGEEETITLKRDLFKSAPRRFSDSMWDSWRESDPGADDTPVKP
ncbi:hypothetical protein Emag_000562 [Eimeria magna]